MEELQILIAKMSTLNIIEAMKLSIEELKQSPRPEKAKPYIDGMSKHVITLHETYETIKQLEYNLRMVNKLHFAAYRDNMELRHKIEKLNKEIDDLKKFL